MPHHLFTTVAACQFHATPHQEINELKLDDRVGQATRPVRFLLFRNEKVLSYAVSTFVLVLQETHPQCTLVINFQENCCNTTLLNIFQWHYMFSADLCWKWRGAGSCGWSCAQKCQVLCRLYDRGYVEPRPWTECQPFIKSYPAGGGALVEGDMDTDCKGAGVCATSRKFSLYWGFCCAAAITLCFPHRYSRSAFSPRMDPVSLTILCTFTNVSLLNSSSLM